MKKLLESYEIEADKVKAEVNLWKTPEESVPMYEISMPVLGKAAEAMISELTNELSDKVPLEIEGIIDPEKVKEMKDKFFQQAKQAVIKKMPELSDSDKNILSGILLHKMFGLGFIEVILADDWLEELVINGQNHPLSVYHKKYGWCKTSKKIETEEEIYNLSSQIGRKVGREINTLNPVMDAHLLSGDRVASTLFPISTAGNTIIIRRFARNPWTPVHFIKPEVKTWSVEIAAFIWEAMQYELNILVAGGTASGKTSMLNSICSFIPPTQRIISIEDTREITLPKNLEWNWVPLTTRNKNPEGKGEVTMLDLMVASLRMRPDRLIVGEVRRKQQAETMFEAMHTGHSVYTTMHADTVEQAKRRLLEPPISIPKGEVQALQLVLVQYRDRRKGLRRTLELAEILEKPGGDLDVNYLFRWHPRTDTFEKINSSVRVFDDLNMHTGMTTKEILEELEEKQKILKWMEKNGIDNIDEVGKVISNFYDNKDNLLKRIERGKGSEDIKQ